MSLARYVVQIEQKLQPQSRTRALDRGLFMWKALRYVQMCSTYTSSQYRAFSDEQSRSSVDFLKRSPFRQAESLQILNLLATGNPPSSLFSAVTRVCTRRVHVSSITNCLIVQGGNEETLRPPRSGLKPHAPFAAVSRRPFHILEKS